MKPFIQKYSVTLKGHRTSISLEPLFWDVLQNLAKIHKKSLAQLICDVEEEFLTEKPSPNLSSALRIYVLREVLKHSI